MKCTCKFPNFGCSRPLTTYEAMKESPNVDIVRQGAVSANMIAVANTQGTISTRLMADFISPQIMFGLTLPLKVSRKFSASMTVYSNLM